MLRNYYMPHTINNIMICKTVHRVSQGLSCTLTSTTPITCLTCIYCSTSVRFVLVTEGTLPNPTGLISDYRLEIIGPRPVTISHRHISFSEQSTCKHVLTMKLRTSNIEQRINLKCKVLSKMKRDGSGHVWVSIKVFTTTTNSVSIVLIQHVWPNV